MPSTRIWGDLARLKVEGVAAVLTERVRQAGSRVREETVEELATRMEQERTAAAQRLHFLRSEDGVKAAKIAANDVIAGLRQIGASIGAAVTDEQDAVLLWHDGFSVSASWRCPYINTLNESAFYVKEWKGRPNIGGWFVNFEEPEELTLRTFSFDRPSRDDAGWVDGDSKRMFSSKQLADFTARLLVSRVRDKIRARE
jgi:hypothetical protein